MTIAASKTQQARTVIPIVAKFFSAESHETQKSSSVEYLTIAGRRVAIEVATIEPRTAGLKAAGKRGLRFDRVAQRLLGTLRAALQGVVFPGTAVAWTVTAPIRLPAKTAASIETKIRTLLASQVAVTRYAGKICGNQVCVRVIKGSSKRQSQLIGFVHNPGSRAEVLLGLTQSLLPHLKVAAGERWLVIADADGSAYLEAYRYLASQLSITAYFKKILLVNGAGQVAEVAK